MDIVAWAASFQDGMSVLQVKSNSPAASFDIPMDANLHITLDRVSRTRLRASRSSISSSSAASTLSCALSPAPLVDGSETDRDVANESESPIVKAESAPASPIEFRDPASELSASPVGCLEGGLQGIGVPPKRRRGRPRKNIVSSPPLKGKGGKTFVRSKTGCITCRKRKKKCDEGKPDCENCEKNGILCEGYAPKKEWQPGKQGKKRKLSDQLPVIKIPRGPRVIFDGLETELDQRFFRNYCHRLGPMLSTKGDDPEQNPFLSLVLGLARADAAVMHSLLSLAGAHLFHDAHRHEYYMRKEEHRNKAMELMRKDINKAMSMNADVSDAIEACLVLQYQLQIIDPTYSGEHKIHYRGFRDYVKFRRHEPVGRFASEFFEWAHMGKIMTELPEDSDPRLPSTYDSPSSSDEFHFAIPSVGSICDGIMLTVLRGLLPFITRITTIRHQFRSYKATDYDPFEEPGMVLRVTDLKDELERWSSGQEEDTFGYAIAELYREAAFVYLHRTVHVSKPDYRLSCIVRQGIEYAESLIRYSSSTKCALLLPVFIFGCAAFETEQRERIKTMFIRLTESNHFANVEPSMRIVERVWQLMDEGGMENGNDRAWDWERIRKDMEYDFPIA